MATFYGTNAADTINSTSITGGVTSDPPGLTHVTDVGDLVYGYGGGDILSGGVGDDTIRGGSYFDYIDGNAGNDQLFGGAAGDNLDGGEGDDLVDGGSNGDHPIGGAGNDTVRGGTGVDRVDGNGGNDSLFGGEGTDWIYGAGGKDLLNGGTEDDFLMGMLGKDTLIGGAGDDVFSFNGSADSTSNAFDIIRAGSGSPQLAFEGAGEVGGDVLDLSIISLHEVNSNHFIFGGRGEGHVWLTDNGTRTVVHAIAEQDWSVEFKLVIVDGDVRATDYTADDFIL